MACMISFFQLKSSNSTLDPSCDLSTTDLQALDCAPANPPPSPSLATVSECSTPEETGSVFSDWESMEDDGKCFLETIVELLPAQPKVYVVI